MHTHLNNRCNKLLHEVVLEKVGPVVMDEVDDESFDVGAVLILISHYHQLPVAQCSQLTRVSVLLAVLKAEDLHHVTDLLVVDDLHVR